MAEKKERFLYIDNLRLLMIVLVIMMHLAVTYSGIGGWYYKEPAEIGTVQTIIFGFFQSFLQGFFMGILFLIAGYFVPASYDKKGFGRFVKDRLIRLGIPTLLYMFIVDPFIYVGLLNNRNFAGGTIFTAYFDYVVTFRFIGASGPLWFALALLIFSFIYAVFRRLIKPKADNSEKKFPGVLKIIALILFIGACSFLVRLVQPVGTSIINMQLCYFSQYVVLFIAGIKCRNCGWLDKLDSKKGKTWLISGFALGSVIWGAVMLFGGALNDNLDVFFGGVSWQSAAYALWESFIGVAMSIGLISLFKENYNRQNNLVRKMSENAFSVYVFHAPVIITLTLLFAPVTLLPLVKFFILTAISIPVCFIFTNYIVRKIPFMKKLLV